MFTLYCCFNLQFDILKVVGGSSGKADGKVVQSNIFQCMFEDVFLASITWTGKSKKIGKTDKALPVTNDKKLSLKRYKGVLKLITELCLAADSKYSEEKCQSDIIYSVLKYAYKKANSHDKYDDDSSSSVKSPSSADSNPKSTLDEILENDLSKETRQVGQSSQVMQTVNRNYVNSQFVGNYGDMKMQANQTDQIHHYPQSHSVPNMAKLPPVINGPPPHVATGPMHVAPYMPLHYQHYGQPVGTGPPPHVGTGPMQVAPYMPLHY